jgi:anoctamin-8
VALFSPVYPLAAFLAFLNNIVEIRVDAAKLCKTMQRPEWTAARDIGSWYAVMNVLGFVAVITNATMITFVGKLLADTEEAAMGGLNARSKKWHLWVIAVAVEHSVLIGRVLILTVWPETPKWIETAQRQLAWHQEVSDTQP